MGNIPAETGRRNEIVLIAVQAFLVTVLFRMLEKTDHEHELFVQDTHIDSW